MEEFSMAQSILQIVSEKGFDGLREILEGVFSKSFLDTPVRRIVPADVYCRTTTAFLHNIQRPENREER